MSTRRGASNTESMSESPGHPARRSRVGVILTFAVFLVLMMAIAVGVLSTSRGQEGVAAATAPVQNADRVEVVYFHRTERCTSCVWAGRMTRKTLESYFASELANGRVTFQEVDVQKPENRVLANKFKASGSQLFLNFVAGGQERIIEAHYVYPQIGNESRFTEILRTLIASGLRKS